MTAIKRINRFARERRAGILLFLVFWLSFVYFHHEKPGWNANTRLGLTYAIVDEGTLSIDLYHNRRGFLTEDKAFFGGRFYSDKSPALSFVAVPFYAIGRAVFGKVNVANGIAVRWWLIAWTASLAGALAALLFYTLMKRFGAGVEEALPLTFFLIYGTNVGGYTSLFFPYLPSIACLLGAYLIIINAREKTASIGAAAGIGFLCSMAGFFEYIYALAGLILMILAMDALRPRGRILWMALGALPPVLMLFSYNLAIFGELTLPYAYEHDPAFRENMARGFMGIGPPDPAVLYYVTIHPFKGLFFYSPILLMFFMGSLWIRRLPRAKNVDLLAAWTILIGYLLVSSGYYMWWGGWSMGARHMIPAVPFLFMPILAAMRRGPRWSNLVVLGGCLSVMLCFPAIALDPQIPAGYDDELLFDPAIGDNLRSVWLLKLLPAFYLHGQVALNPFADALPHLLRIVPLILFWIVAFRFVWQWEKRKEMADGDPRSRGAGAM